MTTRAPVRWPFLGAAVFGILHAVATFYWALGGHWLLNTIDSSLVDQFAGRRWLLVLIGVVKLTGALAPVWLARHSWPAPRLTRPPFWAAAAVLVIWGGVNTVVGNLVLADVVRPSHGFDRTAMAGHAWLWDPLFLAWGLMLGLGMWSTRRRTGRVSARWVKISHHRHAGC